MESLDGYLTRRGNEANALARRLSLGHTPREILQQPWTWRTTVAQLKSQHESLEAALWEEKPKVVLLCGAGTSDYVGRSVQEAVRKYRQVEAVVAPTTDFVLRPRAFFPLEGEGLMVHFARSGESPESLETLRIGLELFGSRSRHWVVTCNPLGALARAAREHADRCALTLLHEATNDRGLAMTSSYSSMTVVGLWFADPSRSFHIVERLAATAEFLIEKHADTLAEIASEDFQRAFYLGTGTLEAAAIESALKMQELTRGEVMAQAETFLAFRHGPISALREGSLLVGFFSSNPHVRAYEEDLAKQLPTRTRLFVCDEATPTLQHAGDVLIEVPGWKAIPDTHKAPTAVLVGQLLGFFRAVALGLNPDDPAGPEGTYSRVVRGVTIHPYREGKDPDERVDSHSHRGRGGMRLEGDSEPRRD